MHKLNEKYKKANYPTKYDLQLIIGFTKRKEKLLGKCIEKHYVIIIGKLFITCIWERKEISSPDKLMTTMFIMLFYI